MISNKLEKYNRKIINVPGDGNCQFHSMCYVLGYRIGDINYNDKLIEIKKNISQYLIDNENFFSDFFDKKDSDDFKKFCKRICENDTSTWGDELTLRAFCTIYNIRVSILNEKGIVLSVIRDKFVYNDMDRYYKCVKNHKKWSEFYFANSHYSPIVKINK